MVFLKIANFWIYPENLFYEKVKITNEHDARRICGR
jgi:hypothetical protein